MTPEYSDFYAALTAALRDRLAVIADYQLRERDPAAHLDRLAAVSQRIVLLQAKLPPEASPRLVHFMQGCSYDKALDFLQSAH